MNNYFVFLMWGPEKMGLDFNINYFLTTTKKIKSHSSVKALDDHMQRFATIWKNFLQKSNQLMTASAGGIFIGLALINLTHLPTVGIAVAVTSVTLLCFMARRSIEASREAWHWLHCGAAIDSSMQKNLLQIKKEQVHLCLDTLNFHRSLQLEELEKMSFLEFFFNNNPLNNYGDQRKPEALNSYYQYFISLKSKYDDYQFKMKGKEKENKNSLNQLKESLKAWQAILEKKATEVVGNSRDEKDKVIKIKILDYIKRRSAMQPYQLIAQLDVCNLFLENIREYAEALIDAVCSDTSENLPDLSNIPLFFLPEINKRIKWPEISFDVNELKGISEEDFNSFMYEMRSFY